MITLLTNATNAFRDATAWRPANATCPQRDYGPALALNKARVLAACALCGGVLAECTVVLAMAMLETTLLDADQRDTHKDGTLAENVSPWNLSLDMVGALNYTSPRGLNAKTQEALVAGACLVLRAFAAWGTRAALDFVRGGRTAFVDGASYGAGQYRATIGTLAWGLANDTQLLTDGRRLECALPGV